MSHSPIDAPDTGREERCCEYCRDSGGHCVHCEGGRLAIRADTELRGDPGPEPGAPIASITCPCCGAALEIMHGDDEGEIGVLGTPAPNV